MSRVKKEIEDTLAHIGVEKRSGRYPWGSGKEGFQRSGDFLSRVDQLKKEGKGDTEIARMMGLTSGEFRVQKSLANIERREPLAATARGLRDEGLSLQQITKKMGFKSDSSVRSLLNEQASTNMKIPQEKAALIKEVIDKKGMPVDVSAGVERELDISKEMLKQSIYLLEREGYVKLGGGIPTGPNKQTNTQYLAPPGTPSSAAFQFDQIASLKEHLPKNVIDPKDVFVYPASMDSKRIMVRYAEDGGKDKDGLIELRRGVEDLSLGPSHYAQVRILIDNKKFAKGMAIYSDDVPEGVDMVFNTNKTKDVEKLEVFKKLEKDPDNPFGSLIKANGQSYYDGKDGKQHLSLINKRAEEGDWEEWKDTLPSQFLAKQPKALIKRQLDLAVSDRQAEFDDIMAINNPTIKKALLKSFSDDCDSSAVHLEAAALPKQKYRVIMPVPEMKSTEVYAPTFDNGEQVALIRFPHGGVFEIPVLTVNNKQPNAKKLLGNAKDAVGINAKVAEQLSGADFDGDTVLTVPTGRNAKIQIHAMKSLQELKDFNPKDEYKAVPGMRQMKREETIPGTNKKRIVDNTQIEMGKISNLITDMTLRGAPINPEAVASDIAKAVKHSMVVIDAAKHNLNYKKSEQDNDIKRLKRQYQGVKGNNGKYHDGAATLLSRAKSETSVDKRIGSPKINQKGKKWYDPTKPEGAYIHTVAEDGYVDRYGRTHSTTYKVYKKVYRTIKDPLTGKDMRDPITKKVIKEEVIDPVTGKALKVDTGKVKKRTQKSTKMAEADDAYELSSGTPQEEMYADYANKMKSMGNSARKELVYAGKIAYDKTAAKTYQEEVARLKKAVNIAEMNAPRERDAQRITNVNIAAKKLENPDMSKEEIKKATQQELNKARIRVGASREKIIISDREWEAIQAGAISEQRLTEVIKNADLDKLRERATPRNTKTVGTVKINRIRALEGTGHTIAQIAEATGLSTATVSKYLN